MKSNLLNDYLELINLPDQGLDNRTMISTKFIEKNVHTFHEAINWVQKFPYKRNKDRGDFLSIFEQESGACSTKHALIAALASEMNIKLNLILGYFFLSIESMPAIRPIMEKYQLCKIPEVHTYLRYESYTLDITFPDQVDYSFAANIEKEIIIMPEQIGEFKVNSHHNFILDFISRESPELLFSTVWAAREEWIRYLYS